MSSQRYISDALKRKKKKIKKIRNIILVTLLLILIGSVIYVLRLPALAINEVKISGNVFVESNEINQKANSLLSKNILFIIPNKNILIFSKKELQQEIEKNPAIVSAKIRKDLFNTLTIDIVEQEKQALYCNSYEKTECFYVNKTGFIYAKVQEIIIPEQEVIIFNEQKTLNLEETLLEEEVYTNILLFVKNLARKEIRVGEVFIKNDGVIEFLTRENVKIITSKFDDYEKDFANIVSIFEEGSTLYGQLNQLDYIDLRFGNKVFYKNKTN